MGENKDASPLLNEWLRQQDPRFKPWDIGGDARLRFEVFDDASLPFPNRDFQKSGAANDDAYLWLRQKAHAGFRHPNFRALVEGRHSEAFGDRDPLDLAEDDFDLHQAFLQLGPDGSGWSAKIGRQEFLYGDGRFVGPRDWQNTMRSFDAAKGRYETESFWMDAFAGRVVIVDKDSLNLPDDYDWFSGLYASSKTIVPKQETDLYFLARNVSEGAEVSPRDIFTIGMRIKSKAGVWHGWDYGAELAGQVGSIDLSGDRAEQRALAASLSSGYSWLESAGRPRVGLEYNYSSGDADPEDGKNETLDNLYPSNHRHYGYMDLIGWRNIHNARLTLASKPRPQLNASLDYHLFWLADDRDLFYPQRGGGRSGDGYGRNSRFSGFVGSELDLEFSWTPARWLAIRAGYAHFFAGSYIHSSKASVGGATDADWVFLQTTLSF